MQIDKTISPTLAKILGGVDHRQWLTVRQQRYLNRLMSQKDRFWWDSLNTDLLHVVLYGEVRGKTLGLVIPQNGVNVFMEILVPPDVFSWLERLHQIMDSNQAD